MINIKRDLELIRKILLTVENAEPGERITEKTFANDYDKKIINTHFKILMDRNFIETKEEHYLVPANGCLYGTTNIRILRLTADGYDYLDSIRDDSIWESTKKALASSGGNVALDVIKKVATSIALSKLGL